jgi:hypothetical protein
VLDLSGVAVSIEPWESLTHGLVGDGSDERSLPLTVCVPVVGIVTVGLGEASLEVHVGDRSVFM